MNFEWRISGGYTQGRSLLTCAPDKSTRYIILWAVRSTEQEPRGIVVYRMHPKKSGYLGEMDFVVDVRMQDEDIAEEGFLPCSLYTDIEEAKELAYRDYHDNILKTEG